MNKIIRIVLVLTIAFTLVACSAATDPAAQIVIDQIQEMTESGEVSAADIEKAKERYNSLPDNLKRQVKNYADLLKLEDAYQEAAESAAEDAAHAQSYYGSSDFLQVSQVCPNAGVSDSITDAGNGWYLVQSNYSKNYSGDVWDAYNQYLNGNFDREWKGDPDYYVYTDSKGNQIKAVVSPSGNYITFDLYLKDN